MTNNLKALKRQIEMFSMFYPNSKIKDCKVDDLADKYQVAVVTINRDLSDLRSMGIPINSVYGKGIEISGEVNENIITDLLLKYLAISNTDLFISDTFSNLAVKDNTSYVYIFSNLNEAIERKNLILLNYKISDNNAIKVIVSPYKLINNNKELEFIGVHNNTVKVFKFKNIISADITEDKDLYNYSDKVKSFMINHSYSKPFKIKLKLQIENCNSLKNFRISNILVTKNIDDKIIEGEINNNSLEELAIWIIKQFGKVKVLEPKELRDKIVEIANSAIQNHKDIPKREEHYEPQKKFQSNIKFHDETSCLSNEEFEKMILNNKKDVDVFSFQNNDPLMSVFNDIPKRIQDITKEESSVCFNASFCKTKIKEELFAGTIKINLPIECSFEYDIIRPSTFNRLIKWITGKR